MRSDQTLVQLVATTRNQLGELITGDELKQIARKCGGVAAAEAKYPEVQILGLDSATEALLERAGADPAARSACHNAMQEPALAEALKEMARTGRPPAGTRTTDLRAHALWATLIARGVRLELDCPECEVFGEPAGDPRAPVPML